MALVVFGRNLRTQVGTHAAQEDASTGLGTPTYGRPRNVAATVVVARGRVGGAFGGVRIG